MRKVGLVGSDQAACWPHELHTVWRSKRCTANLSSLARAYSVRRGSRTCPRSRVRAVEYGYRAPEVLLLQRWFCDWNTVVDHYARQVRKSPSAYICYNSHAGLHVSCFPMLTADGPNARIWPYPYDKEEGIASSTVPPCGYRL